jgi:hypothetical protein
MNKINIAYLLCNRTLHDKRMRQGGPISPEEYLRYLEYSIKTLLFNEHAEYLDITIWLAEIEKDENYFTSLSNMIGLFKNVEIQIKLIDSGFVEERYKLNKVFKLTSSQVHHMFLYYILAHTSNQYLILVDADTLFIQKGFIQRIKSELDQQQKSICGFLQPPFQNDEHHIEKRLHTVFCLINMEELNKWIDINYFFEKIYSENIYDLMSKIKNTALRKCLLERVKSGAYRGDTFTELTYFLIYDIESEQIIDINKLIESYFIDKDFIFSFGNEYFLHGKYLDKKILDSLLNSIKNRPDILDKIENAMQLLFNNIEKTENLNKLGKL